MKKAVIINAPKEAANFFNKLLKEKADRKEEIRRKYTDKDLNTIS